MNEFPYWWTTVPSLQSPAPSPQPPTWNHQSTIPNVVDVVVVGAGYTGLSAARRLAKAGATVVVIEREHLGFGASSRNGGQILTGLRVDPGTLIGRYGTSRARRLFDAANASIDYLEQLIGDERIECEYERCGHLHAAWKPSHFPALVDEQALLAREFHHEVEVVSRAEQRREIGSDRYHGVLVDRRSRALNPARYVIGLAEAATRAGARVVTHTAVLQIRRDQQRWRVATTAGEISARDVMVGTNGYTNGAVPALQRRFVPVGSYIVATEPLPSELACELLPTRRVAFDSKHFLYYFRLTQDRRLLFGGRVEFSEPDADTTRRAADRLRHGMIDVFPQLAHVGLEYVWSGKVAFTRDEMPRAGRLENVYFAGGYCGHGIALATELGDLMARRIAGERIDHPLVDQDFPPIPLYRGRPWFLPLAGAYYQVKDWVS